MFANVPRFHHLMVAATRTITIEIGPRHSVLKQIASRGALFLDRAGWRNVVGGDAVAEQSQDARPGQIVDRAGFPCHVHEIRGMLDVSRHFFPLKQVALGNGQTLPVGIAFEDLAVFLVEHLGAHRTGHGVADFFLSRPDVLQVDRLAVAAHAQRLAVQVDVHAAGQGVGDNQRWRRQVVRPHFGMDASLEIAIARKHRGDHQAALVDLFRHRGWQRSTIPNT